MEIIDINDKMKQHMFPDVVIKLFTEMSEEEIEDEAKQGLLANRKKVVRKHEYRLVFYIYLYFL